MTKTRTQSERHTCHWPGCPLVVQPHLWGCRRHWFALPVKLRIKMWMHYRPGQEIDKRPSPEYLQVAREVQEWITTGQQQTRRKP